MKRIALSLILAILSLPLLADSVSSQRARIVADRFMAADGTRAGNVVLSGSFDTQAHLMATRSAEEPAFYVFNRPGGGFVIISGDDAFGPVLAYSYTGSFPTDTYIPTNLRGWMEDMAFSIGDIRSEHLTASTEVAQRWAAYEQPTTRAGIRRAEPVKYYATATWSQSAPYNLFCPNIGGSLAVTGCVATSIGILMHYYKYPTRASKTIPSHSGTGYTMPSRTPNYDYQWDKMLMIYTGDGYTTEEAEACARLLADIGQVGQLDYGVESTGGQTAEVLGLMTEYFGYDKGLVNESRYYYTDDEWAAKLKKELDQRPLSYTGRSESGGHAFVMDGYDTDGLFHMNWGWNGSRNGYYGINAFYKYVSNHAATFGFKPDAGGSFQPLYAIYVGTTSAGVSYKGLEMNSASITPNVSFSMKVGGIINKGFETYDVEAAVCHCDVNGNFKSTVSGMMDLSTLGQNYWRGFSPSCKITDPIEPGDRLYVFYHTKGQNDWVRIKCPNNEGAVEYIDIASYLSLEASTAMNYDKATGTLTIHSLRSGISIAIAAESGASLSQYITEQSGELSIKVNQLPAGKYTVTLSSSTEKKTLNIVK